MKMVKVTEQLIRKKSEHNELIISTLEELSLHQEDIERIEYIQESCRELKILLLQSNIIFKIENLYKLKNLEYLNLALNNIEVIENLDKLESLTKLDLTLNFIGNLRSICNLQNNYNLKDLHLIGNPCADYSGYRTYVLAALPQLSRLDGEDIKLSDKIAAKKDYKGVIDGIIKCEIDYNIKRDEQKIRVAFQKGELERNLKNIEDENERNQYFWNTTTENCPESRVDIALQHRKGRGLNKSPIKKKSKYSPKLFAPCGRPYNINQCKVEFEFSDEPTQFKLCLHVFKYLDTSLISVDVESNYVRVCLKGNLFQLALNELINISESKVQRSQVSGHLLIVMPKLQSNIEELKLKNSNYKKQVELAEHVEADLPELI